MALIKCLECGNEVSDKALSCPKCGCPINLNVENNTKTKKKSKAPLIIIIIIVFVIVAVVGTLFATSKIGDIAGLLTKDNSSNEVNEPKETVILSRENFLDYFDISIECGKAKIDKKTPGLVIEYCDFSTEMTVTIKAKVPLTCENGYVSFDPHASKSYEDVGLAVVSDDKMKDIKLDNDGYYTGSKTISVSNIPGTSFIFTALNDDLEILDASGTITYNPEKMAEIKSNE